MSQFCNRIKSVRLEKGFTQKQFAQLLEITERAYQYYESGQREPTIDKLVHIADKLDISTDYLLGRSDNLRDKR